MWQRFSRYDFRIIGYYLGVLICAMGLLELVPFVAGLVSAEWHAAARYLVCAGVTFSFGSLLRMVMPIPGKLTQRHAVAVTCLAWLILALAGSIPLAFSGHYASLLDAFFEGMSAWTTTGASMVQDLDHMAIADNMWRFTMQAVGGLGVVVIALSLGLFGKAVDSSLYSSEGRSEHVIPNIMQTSRFIVRFSAAFVVIGTVVLSIICLIIGMEPIRAFFNGLWLAIASFNTGGMTSMSSGIVYYHSGALELFIMVLILLGSINFTLHGEVWRGHLDVFFEDLEIQFLAIWLSVVLAAFAIIMSTSGAYTDVITLVRRSVFTIVAAFSSTGFQNITTNQMTTVVPSGALLLLIFVMAIGGSSGSTTGGIKALRVGILVKELYAYVKDLLAPASARQVVSYYHVGRHPLTQDLIRANVAVLIVYGVLFIITTIATLAFGYDATSSLFESISMVSNIGMSSGIIQAGMPTPLKLLYIFDMWAGRLEYVTLLALVISLIASLKPRKRGGKRG